MGRHGDAVLSFNSLFGIHYWSPTTLLWVPARSFNSLFGIHYVYDVINNPFPMLSTPFSGFPISLSLFYPRTLLSTPFSGFLILAGLVILALGLAFNSLFGIPSPKNSLFHLLTSFNSLFGILSPAARVVHDLKAFNSLFGILQVPLPELEPPEVFQLPFRDSGRARNERCAELGLSTPFSGFSPSVRRRPR